MDGLDDLAMAAAIGLPIVLVCACAVFLALTRERPGFRHPETGRAGEAGGLDEEDAATTSGPNR